ncbi:group 1 glycosyl transferase [Hylemonella gracilis ATCC 19624]|uniref:Group 1 glycosyl transferase n=2 Tax=Hylemonella gracilis TaxID=80880 RepID=F3KSC8_9BURK|nr:group 1 glycosyl transferase [Hylemonella gracilis ATCC 19624]
MNQYFEPSLRRATRVLTDSDFVKRELMDVFGMPAERIQTVPLGAEDLFRPMAVDETRAALTPRQLTHGQYLLAVGTLEPRKNLGVALRAYMNLPSALRHRFPLVLAGMKGWSTGMLEQQMAPLLQTGEIRLLGYVPRAELAAIIAGAAALVYPSIYEGFGLPPLEAMRCGVPVIASNVSSIPEVVGRNGSGGGILIDPQDVDGFQQAMSMMLTASDVRADLANNALAYSKQFSWERTVTETMAAYRLACGKS